MKTVRAVDASLNFLSLLRDVESEETIEIISNGRAVAALSPVSSPLSATEVAKTRLLQRLRSQNRTGIQAWSRDKFYDVWRFLIASNSVAIDTNILVYADVLPP